MQTIKLRARFLGESLVPRFNFDTGFVPYWNTLLFLTAVGFLGRALESVVGYRAVGFVFMLGVLVVGMIGSRGPALFAALFSALAWNFFFIPPHFTFIIDRIDDALMCLTYFVVASITGYLTSRIRKTEQQVQAREDRAKALFEILQSMSSSHEESQIVNEVASKMGAILGGICAVILVNEDGNLERNSVGPLKLTDYEILTAQRRFASSRAQDLAQENEVHQDWLYIPLVASHETVGVFIFHAAEEGMLSEDRRILMGSLCRHLALALERQLTERRSRLAKRLEERRGLGAEITQSMAEGLKTPLKVIGGIGARIGESRNLKEIMASEMSAANEMVNERVRRLFALGNLGVLSEQMEWNDIHDVIAIMIKRLGRNLDRDQVSIEFAPNLPLVKIDFDLIELALSNIMLRLTRSAPTGMELEVSLQEKNRRLLIVIEDGTQELTEEILVEINENPGLPSAAFEGTVDNDLVIAKKIIELHGGKVQAQNRIEGGSRIAIWLPCEKSSGVRPQVS